MIRTAELQKRPDSQTQQVCHAKTKVLRFEMGPLKWTHQKNIESPDSLVPSRPAEAAHSFLFKAHTLSQLEDNAFALKTPSALQDSAVSSLLATSLTTRGSCILIWSESGPAKGRKGLYPKGAVELASRYFKELGVCAWSCLLKCWMESCVGQ